MTTAYPLLACSCGTLSAAFAAGAYCPATLAEIGIAGFGVNAIDLQSWRADRLMPNIAVTHNASLPGLTALQVKRSSHRECLSTRQRLPDHGHLHHPHPAGRRLGRTETQEAHPRRSNAVAVVPARRLVSVQIKHLLRLATNSGATSFFGRVCTSYQVGISTSKVDLR